MTYKTKEEYFAKVAELRIELSSIKDTDVERASYISFTIIKLMAEAIRQFKTK